MTKLITLLVALAALVPSPDYREISKEPLIDQPARLEAPIEQPTRPDIPVEPPALPKTRIDRVARSEVQTEQKDYAIEGETPDPADSYTKLKEALDNRFAYMFDLRKSLEERSSELNADWEEYYALHDKYHRELRKIIAIWTTQENYSIEDAA